VRIEAHAHRALTQFGFSVAPPSRHDISLRSGATTGDRGEVEDMYDQSRCLTHLQFSTVKDIHSFTNYFFRSMICAARLPIARASRVMAWCGEPHGLRRLREQIYVSRGDRCLTKRNQITSTKKNSANSQ